MIRQPLTQDAKLMSVQVGAGSMSTTFIRMTTPSVDRQLGAAGYPATDPGLR